MRDVGSECALLGGNLNQLHRILRAGLHYAMRLGKIVLDDVPANITPDVLKNAFLGN